MGASKAAPRTGRFGAHTLSAVIKHGGFLYSSDSYNDDLPYWVKVDGTPHLIVPYTLEVNDMKFAVPPGFSAGEGWFNYMKDAFDTLYAEGAAGAPKMMSIGLHCRLAGRPGRTAALARSRGCSLSLASSASLAASRLSTEAPCARTSSSSLRSVISCMLGT